MSSSSSQRNSTTEPMGRLVGGTECSWCKSVPSGTGITVMSFLFSRDIDKEALESAVQFLQNCHPILKACILFDPSRNSYVFDPSSSYASIRYFDETETANTTLATGRTGDDQPGDVQEKFHLLLEHELNKNDWSCDNEDKAWDLLFISVYALGEGNHALLLRAHTAGCDLSSAVTLMRELESLYFAGDEKKMKIVSESEYNPAMEELIPRDKANKPFWKRGVDVLGYSLNSFRFSNIEFIDPTSTRRSQVLRLKLNLEETQSLLAACEARSIKLFGALIAASFIAARSTKNIPKDLKEKFASVTLIDCRSILDPSLRNNQMGFYHSAIMNSHDVSENDELWELAIRCHSSVVNMKKCNKHLTDIRDVNMLMNMAIDKPSLTVCGAVRTTFVSVFEESVIEECRLSDMESVGIIDRIGCSSVHGIGPSIAIYDSVRDGQLDCACVYPSPLHSREQMDKLVQDMKTILVNGCCPDITNGVC